MAKKELNQEQLEKVSGGVTGAYDRVKYLSGKLTTGASYQHEGEDLFFYDNRSYTLIYGKLIRCWELEKFFGAWSYTQYDVEIKESSSSNDDIGVLVVPKH